MTNTASPWTRLLAYILEFLIYTPITLILIILTRDLVLSLALILFIGLIQVIFTGYLVSRFGGSLGKLLSGISIVTSNSNKLSFRMAIFRNYIGYMASSLLFWLGFIWIFVDKQRRGWHDQISDTYVVVTRKSGWLLGLVSLVALIILNIWLVYLTLAIFHRLGILSQYGWQ